MRTTFLRAITFVVLAGALAVAQQPRRTPPDPAQMVQHQVDFLSKRLSLNSQQQQQATSIYTEAASNAKSLHDQMHTAEQNLQTAVQKNDTAGIEQASNTIGSLMGQMTMTHAKADAAMFQILQPDQQSKFAQMQSHHGWGGLRGHGRPGGPPPGASFK